MDPCLHLALLETAYEVPVVREFSKVPMAQRPQRHAELLGTPIPAGASEARWTDTAQLLDAVPEGADTTIRSLDGVAAHQELTLLHLVEAAVDDLGPLAGLPRLRLLSLGVTPTADLRPLLACRALTRVSVDCRDDLLAAEQREVLDALAARGVHVDQLVVGRSTPAPFADPILKLAVIDLLGLPLPTVECFDEYELDEGNLARVLAIELTQEQLDGIERLHWTGGGYDIQHAVWSQWDGESGEFDIRSLQGIEALRNLKRLEVSPLERLPEEQVAALRAAGVTVTEW